MKCDECEYFYFEETDDRLNNRPSCRKKYVPYVDTHCTEFKEHKLSEGFIKYLKFLDSQG